MKTDIKTQMAAKPAEKVLTELEAKYPLCSSTLLAAARALCERLKVIHDDPLYLSVWTSAWNHGINYENGPKYDKELEALEAAVKAANVQS
jgi:hypothetical protein